jgi:hypothetical protein
MLMANYAEGKALVYHPERYAEELKVHGVSADEAIMTMGPDLYKRVSRKVPG